MLTKSTWMKIAAVALLCIAACGAVAGCSYGCTSMLGSLSPGLDRIGASAAGYGNVGSGSVAASQVRGIDLEWLAGSVRFEVVDDANAESEGEIRLEETSGAGEIDDRWKLRWDVREGVLKVAYCGPFGGLVGCSNLNGPQKELLVSIPKRACQNLDTVSIEGFSGEYRLDGLECKRLKLDLASGHVEGGNAAFDGLELDVASGNVNLSASVANAIDLELASGDVALACTGAMPREVKVEAASGNVVLTVPPDSGFTAKVDKASGVFDCGLPGARVTDDGCICGDGSARVDIDMSSGNVTVQGSEA